MGVDATIDITPEERQTVLALLQRHLPGTAAWVYGSRAKWTSTPTSDLDLVVFATPEQQPHVGDLREAFEESNLPFRVDLFVWDDVPESFRQRIEADRAPLVGQEAGDGRVAATKSESDWSLVPVEQLAEKVAMGPFGSSIKVATFVPDGVPIISGQHLHGTRVDESPGFNFITQEHAQRLANANVRRGDVIFTHAGNIGQVAYIPETSRFERYVISQRQFYLRCDCSKAIPEYVARYFTSAEGQHQLLANTSQVGVPSIAQPVSYLRTLRIPVPPLSEQRAIAHILGTLDDKIELNRRMDATLEAMARALFRSWFVDFDPVRAKMEGRDTGLPKDVADLFPDRLADSEQGNSPQGWESVRLDEVAGITKGRSYRRRELVESDTALVTLKSFVRGGGYRPEGLKSFRGAYKSEQVIQPGEVIVACTDVTQAAEVIGRSAVVGPTSSFRTLVGSLDVLIVRPKHAAVGRAFVYYLTGTEKFVAHTGARTTGTTVLHLAKDAVGSFQFALPPRPLLERFERYAGSLLSRVHVNAVTGGLLADLRDTLLPLLVSGSLRISSLGPAEPGETRSAPHDVD